MQPLKRKTPYTASPSPGFGTPRTGVKAEPVDGDVKRQRFSAGPSRSFTSSPHIPDVRTAAVSMSVHLKAMGTLGWQDAYFHSQAEFPSHDPGKVLEYLKRLERVVFNEVNKVFSWDPELTLANEAQIRGYIRTNSTPTQPVLLRTIKEALPPNGSSMIEDLERKGEVLIMRGLAGVFKDLPLPRLGGANGMGMKINDSSGPAGSRIRSVWWDELRERDRAGTRVDDDFIFAWDEVSIKDTDDIVKLLEKENLGAGSAMPAAPKIVASAPVKKKKAARRPLKISNVHMKEQGIDFSKDYEKPS